MVTCHFSSKEWTKVVIVNQAFVQRNQAIQIDSPGRYGKKIFKE